MKKKFYLLPFLFLLVVSVIGINCKKESDKAKKQLTNVEVVPVDFAQKLAGSFSMQAFNNKKLATTSTEPQKAKTIKNRITMKDAEGNPAFYIFNYANNEGFIMVSAEYKHEPILAYVDHGEVKQDTVPAGLVMWVEKTLDNITLLRKGLYDNSKIAYAAWTHYIKENKIPVPENVKASISKLTMPTSKGKNNSVKREMPPYEPNCDDVITTTVGPLIPVSWGQGCSYNDLLNNMNCSRCYNPQPLTGCVATAMAQVIRYWRYPYFYNYSSMPSNYGNYEVQQLMRHAGYAIGMDYGCNSSSAYEDRVPAALKNVFRFSSATYKNYNTGSYQEVQQNLNLGRPVMLGGISSTFSSIWPFYYIGSTGHEWVCDGYQSTYYPCYGSTLYFHMNWGWDGAYNGWYGFNNWAVAGDNYQYARTMIVDIHP